MDNDIVPVKIDFAEIRGNKLNESFLMMFGSWIETILGRMFGNNIIPVTIKGTKQEISSFANTLGRERRYLESYKKYGLDNPRTYKNKEQLNSSIKKFENATGIKWPFKEESFFLIKSLLNYYL